MIPAEREIECRNAHFECRIKMCIYRMSVPSWLLKFRQKEATLKWKLLCQNLRGKKGWNSRSKKLFRLKKKERKKRSNEEKVMDIFICFPLFNVKVTATTSYCWWWHISSCHENRLNGYDLLVLELKFLLFNYFFIFLYWIMKKNNVIKNISIKL